MLMILISSGVSVDGDFQPWLHCCGICTDSREPRGFENNSEFPSGGSGWLTFLFGF